MEELEIRRAAGTYAEERYRRGRKSWRRRMVFPAAVRLLPPCLMCLVIAVWFGGSFFWFIVGATWGLGLAMFLLVWLQPSNEVLKWGIGAEGERRTAKALASLERDGWDVRHDIQTSRGNIDHLVRG